MEQRTGSKLGTENIMAVYCHSAYLTYMQSTSCEMPGWMKLRLKGSGAPINVGQESFMEVPIWIKEYSIRNAGLDEAQAGIKISRRNSNNLTYAGNTTLMTKSKEELKSLLMKVKEKSEKAVLKFNIQKTNIMASGPITLWQIDGENWK